MQDAYGNYSVGVLPAPATPGTSMFGGGLHGSGVPDNSLGENGSTYIDDDTGDLYIKYNNSWNLFQGAPGGSGEAGVGSPEGVITASVGTTYVDTSTEAFWVKKTGSGNTGWVAITGGN